MPMFKNARLRRPLVIALAVLMLVLLVWGLYWIVAKNRAVAPRGMTVAVGVAPVRQEDAPLRIDALGTVNSTYTATVRSRVDGQLMKLHFTEGQLVKEGQLLAELDARPFKAALMQAEGQLMRDTALLENARLDLKRYRQLLEQNSIAKQQVDTQAALVKQYEGTVKLDQGAVDNARLQLAYSRITAPISGRAGLRQVDLGNIVHAGDTGGIVTITQEQPINVVFSIPEVDLGQVLQAYSANRKLAVSAWDRENRRQIAEGTLLALDNRLNTDTGTIGIKAKFANTRGELFPNQFVNVRLHLGSQADAILVPTVAIQLGKLGHTVYRVNDNGTVSLVKVKTGATSGDNTIIEDGLEPGQIVVIDGVDKLRDGSKIRIVDRHAAASGDTGSAPKAASPESASPESAPAPNPKPPRNTGAETGETPAPEPAGMQAARPTENVRTTRPPQAALPGKPAGDEKAETAAPAGNLSGKPLQPTQP